MPGSEGSVPMSRASTPSFLPAGRRPGSRQLPGRVSNDPRSAQHPHSTAKTAPKSSKTVHPTRCGQVRRVHALASFHVAPCLTRGPDLDACEERRRHPWLDGGAGGLTQERRGGANVISRMNLGALGPVSSTGRRSLAALRSVRRSARLNLAEPSWTRLNEPEHPEHAIPRKTLEIAPRTAHEKSFG